MLYQQDLLKLEANTVASRSAGASIDDYASQIVLGVEANRCRVDTLLEQHLQGWSLARLGVLERAILRVAAYELLLESEVPIAVVVDEAVNLAKRFCSGEAGSLVNGILGAAAEEARKGSPDADSNGGASCR